MQIIGSETMTICVVLYNYNEKSIKIDEVL